MDFQFYAMAKSSIVIPNVPFFVGFQNVANALLVFQKSSNAVLVHSKTKPHKYSMNWLHIFIMTAAFAMSGVATLSLDPVASVELEQCLGKGECVVSMRHIRPRRKLHISIEALFMIDLPTLKRKLSFFLDRRQQRVTLDKSHNGVTESQHFELPQINETSTIRSLALHFQEDRIALLVDCTEAVAHELDMQLPKLITQMAEPGIKLYRERKYPLFFDENLERAQQRGNCQKNGGVRHGNRRTLRNHISEKEKNQKREVRNWHNQEPDIHVERGDIPIMHDDCEDAMTKSMEDLLALMKLLREDVAQQRVEISYLRSLLENCAGCKAPTTSSLVMEKTCRTANPCYLGVECIDSLTGPRCGRCPAGMIGDGTICKPGITCADRPCFIGVQCRDTLSGALCASCPIGYEGDGRSCKIRGAIMLPSHNVQHYQRQYTARKYSVMTS